MYCYRLRVTLKGPDGERPLAKGTGWFVDCKVRLVVVTAFHVVGTRETHQWLHQQESESVKYILDTGAKKVRLVPLSFDDKADVAILACRDDPGPIKALQLADEFAVGGHWRAEGF